jgi:hypothetical protein
LEAAIREAICEPFDLVTGPLLRGRLFRLSGNEAVLAVTASLHPVSRIVRSRAA